MSAAPQEIPVLDAAAVAALLALPSEAAFASRRPRLVREHGFPRALPGLGPRWGREAVLAWIAAAATGLTAQPGGLAGLAPERGPAVAPPRPKTEFEAARERLEARYGRGA